jgi:hypothetical protein
MPATPVVLYRRGNTRGPRMDNVRDDDLWISPDGQEVGGRSGGVSCFSVSPCEGKGPEWKLSEQTPYSDDLYLRQDNGDPTHWTWEPAVDMPMSRYKDLLVNLGLAFEKV